MKNLIAVALFCFPMITLTHSASADLIITRILDGPNSSEPKVLELFVSGTMDLSSFSVERSANGAPFGNTTSLSSLGTLSDTFVYLFNSTFDEATFETDCGEVTNSLIVSGAIGNGNDAVRIVSGGNTIDQFGDPDDVSDSSDFNNPWDYRDGAAARIDGTGPDGGFTLANWTVTGRLNGMSNSQVCAAGNFGAYAVPEPSSFLSLLFVTALLTRSTTRVACRGCEGV